MSNLHRCRLCHGEIADAPLLRMAPFPKAAQYYPEPAEFAEDLGIDLEVFGCPRCGLLQLCCEPVGYHREVITAASFSPDARAARLLEFTAFVERFGLHGKAAIEVGCGKGGMVEIMTAAGLEAVGLEWSHKSVTFGASKGRAVIQGYLTELDESFDGCYGAFVSLNYIEHQPDSRAFIQALHRITTPDAVGYITAPNVGYLLRTHTLYEFVADHLVYFTEETLRRAFETNGFEVVESRLINNDNDVAITVRKRQWRPLAGMASVERLVGELRALVRECQAAGKRVAVWGAGHRTLALLAIAGLDDIAFIVDSADFKQGKYSPLMHSRIASPAELQASDVAVVIVAVPGLYPDEVVKTIRGFLRPIEIFKLQDNRLMAVE
jgi:2-polyprenyl-3-methyl-5-hydroxy-6-metoxy-1,4-benzoquinol methylase